MIITRLTTNDKSQRGWTITVIADEPAIGSKEVSVSYQIETKSSSRKIEVRVHLDNGSVWISNLHFPGLTPEEACLIKCGVVKVASKVIGCWIDGQRKPRELWDCLKSKGGQLAEELWKCAQTCLINP